MMEEELRSIIKLLNQSKMLYWMNNGTLLGLVRNGMPIEGDNDIDISIWAENEHFF